MITINQDGMMKLAFGLRDRGIEFSVKSFFDGIQIVVGDFDWDAICHSGSYGHENGLIEVMGLPQCEDDVIGYLTAEEVLKMIDGLDSETINHDYESTPTPVKMRMTEKLADDLMNNLASLAISANGYLPETEEELELCENYAKKTFIHLCEEWEKTMEGTWEVVPNKNDSYDL